LITAEVLACATRWVHRVGRGRPSIEILLPDGREIKSERVLGTLNRLYYPAIPHLAPVAEQERGYAVQELYAFYLGWLYSLPQPILNPPTPQGLCGRWRYPVEWVALAAKAGLKTRSVRLSSRSHDAATLQPSWGELGTRLVYCVAGNVIGEEIPSEIAEGCRRLAALSETPLLGIEFDAGPSWTFLSASATPDLMEGGERLIDALLAVLRGAATEERVPA
jgi:hypothetical protein